MARGDIVKTNNVIVELLEEGGEGLRPFPEKTADSTTEKHVPVIEKKADHILVKVGSVPHPMEEDHWIQWIELRTKSEGIPLAEAVVILEGWVKRVKEELQKPYTDNLKFGK